MFFNSGLFLILYLALFGVYHSRPWSRIQRIALILASSLMFYFISDAAHLPLLLFLVTVHYFAGQVSALYSKPALIGVITLDVLILVYFKFFSHGPLPLGLSFYIFQCLAYAIDILSRNAVPVGSLLEFSGTVTYFPHLPAGPLLKTRQISQGFSRLVNWDDCKSGILFFCTGLAKKTIADLLAPLTDAYAFQGGENWMEALIGMLAGLARIYGDFSGYTDMAWGLSLLLGFQLPVNFFRPFSSQSMRSYYSERWHISLANWIRDYLFIPLSLVLVRRRIPVEVGFLISFLIMSFWHGSNLTYVIWGFYIGAIIILEDKIKFREGIIGVIRTNILVALGLVFFFAKDVNGSLRTLTEFFTLNGHASQRHYMELLLTGFALVSVIVLSYIDNVSVPWIIRFRSYWIIVFALSLTAFFLISGNRSFIYFDF